MPGRFPRAYLNDIPNPETVSGIEYVPFRETGIGARRSSMPPSASSGPKKLEHVGGSASGKAK